MPCCCSRVFGWHHGWPRLPVFQIAKASASVRDRGHAEPQVLARRRRPTTEQRHLQPQRHEDLDPERRVAGVPEHRHAAAAQVHRHPGDHRDDEHHREERRPAVHEPHQRVGQGEARHQVHAQQVEVAAEVGLGGVHRHRARPEQHHEHGVGRREARVGTQRDAEAGALPGIPGDGQPGDDEAEVAPACWRAGGSTRGGPPRRSRRRGRRPGRASPSARRPATRASETTAVTAATTSGRRSRPPGAALVTSATSPQSPVRRHGTRADSVEATQLTPAYEGVPP